MQVTVHVKPGSRKGPLVEVTESAEGSKLTVFVQQRAVDGQANTAVISLLAKYFRVSKSSITILRGHTSRIKLVLIEH